MRVLFILNPKSGHLQRRPGISQQLQRFISSSLPGAALAETKAPGHATELAREAAAEGMDCVVAVGGDGTVNEVASGLLGTTTVLGILPLGSGNGLARELRIPLGLEAALGNLLTGRPRRIDSGLANGHPFFCTCGTGFDAHVVQRFNNRAKRGFLAYVQEGLRAWRNYEPASYDLKVDGLPQSPRRALFLTVANASQFGNEARIAPKARLDDGSLELVVVRPLSTLQALLTTLRLFRGTLRHGPLTEYFTAQSFELRPERAGYFHVDGEVRPLEGALSVSLRPQSLSVLCPAH
jgi:YegS/Rv2252/BmrU family lipid kinase